MADNATFLSTNPPLSTRSCQTGKAEQKKLNERERESEEKRGKETSRGIGKSAAGNRLRAAKIPEGCAFRRGRRRNRGDKNEKGGRWRGKEETRQTKGEGEGHGSNASAS